MNEFTAVEKIDGTFDGPGDWPGRDLLFICDHASNKVPEAVGDLGLSSQDMARHIAWDIGARGVTLGLAGILGAPAVLSTYSRLVIDPNRAEDDPTLIMKLYDGSIIAGNRNIDEAETARRITAYYRPYHAAVDAALDQMIAAGQQPVIVSIHSFTPNFRGRSPRPWHISILWDRDKRMITPMLRRLRAEPDLIVGDNVPYTGRLRGDCLWRHGTARGIAHVLIEIRNDLIVTREQQEHWSRRLAPIICDSLHEMRLAQQAPDLLSLGPTGGTSMTEIHETELEAAVFRRLRDHLRTRTDVQNIDLMNLGGFCRNCLSRWYQEAAAEQGKTLSKEQAREIVYGMPYDAWREKYQTEATPEQKAAFAATKPDH